MRFINPQSFDTPKKLVPSAWRKYQTKKKKKKERERKNVRCAECVCEDNEVSVIPCFYVALCRCCLCLSSSS